MRSWHCMPGAGSCVIRQKKSAMQTANTSLNCSYLINFFLPSESRVRSKPPSAESLSRKVCWPPSPTLRSLFSSRSAEVRGNVVTSYRVRKRFFRQHLINDIGNAVIGGEAKKPTKKGPHNSTQQRGWQTPNEFLTTPP